MSIHVVILNGANGAGKDTFVNEMSELLCDTTLIKHESVINPIKTALSISGIWDSTKDERGRILLADMLIMAKKYNPHYVTDYVVKRTKNFIGTLYNMSYFDSVLFFDIRDPNDIKESIEAINSRLPMVYGTDTQCERIRVHTLLLKGSTEPVANTDADKNVDNYNYDTIIELDHEDPEVLDSCVRNYIDKLHLSTKTYFYVYDRNKQTTKFLENIYENYKNPREFLNAVKDNCHAWALVNLIESEENALDIAKFLCANRAIEATIKLSSTRKMPDTY